MKCWYHKRVRISSLSLTEVIFFVRVNGGPILRIIFYLNIILTMIFRFLSIAVLTTLSVIATQRHNTGREAAHEAWQRHWRTSKNNCTEASRRTGRIAGYALFQRGPRRNSPNTANWTLSKRWTLHCDAHNECSKGYRRVTSSLTVSEIFIRRQGYISQGSRINL